MTRISPSIWRSQNPLVYQSITSLLQTTGFESKKGHDHNPMIHSFVTSSQVCLQLQITGFGSNHLMQIWWPVPAFAPWWNDLESISNSGSASQSGHGSFLASGTPWKSTNVWQSGRTATSNAINRAGGIVWKSWTVQYWKEGLSDALLPIRTDSITRETAAKS